METTIKEALEQCRVIKHTIVVPKTKTIELRNSVFEQMENIGGAWQGNGSLVFSFKKDPTKELAGLIGADPLAKTSLTCNACDECLTIGDLISTYSLPFAERTCEKCTEGSSPKDDKKRAHFESSPEPLAEKLVRLAVINNGDRIAEPSAGTGAIVKAILKAHPKVKIFCYEILPVCQKMLQKIHAVNFIRPDFLAPNFPYERFDKIIASPPTKDNAYIYHIREMHARLETGGMLVTLALKEYQNSKAYPHVGFRHWLDNAGAIVIDLTPEELSEVGFTTPFVIIIINK